MTRNETPDRHALHRDFDVLASVTAGDSERIEARDQAAKQLAEETAFQTATIVRAHDARGAQRKNLTDKLRRLYPDPSTDPAAPFWSAGKRSLVAAVLVAVTAFALVPSSWSPFADCSTNVQARDGDVAGLVDVTTATTTTTTPSTTPENEAGSVGAANAESSNGSSNPAAAATQPRVDGKADGLLASRTCSPPSITSPVIVLGIVAALLLLYPTVSELSITNLFSLKRAVGEAKRKAADATVEAKKATEEAVETKERLAAVQTTVDNMAVNSLTNRADATISPTVNINSRPAARTSDIDSQGVSDQVASGIFAYGMQGLEHFVRAAIEAASSYEVTAVTVLLLDEQDFLVAVGAGGSEPAPTLDPFQGGDRVFPNVLEHSRDVVSAGALEDIAVGSARHDLLAAQSGLRLLLTPIRGTVRRSPYGVLLVALDEAQPAPRNPETNGEVVRLARAHAGTLGTIIDYTGNPYRPAIRGD